VALAALVASGCRTPHGLEDLERELRYQEDMIYELQDYVATYKSHLNECRTENERLRRDDGKNGDGRRSGGGLVPKAEGVAPPENGLVPPVIELPELDGAEDEEFDDASGPSIDAAQSPIAAHRAYAGAEFPKDDRIAALTLDGSSTWASNSRGVEILLEPRNAAGQIVPPAGEISVALLDPAAATADAARVARWQFTAEQTRLLTRDARPGEGLRLELVWPDGPPRHDDLRLFVRIATPDGRRLVAEQDLRVGAQQLHAASPQPAQNPAQDSPSNWSASTRQRPPVATEAHPPWPIQVEAKNDTPPNARQAAERRPPARAARRPEWSPYR
jgi:hypothetical protein